MSKIGHFTHLPAPEAGGWQLTEGTGTQHTASLASSNPSSVVLRKFRHLGSVRYSSLTTCFHSCHHVPVPYALHCPRMTRPSQSTAHDTSWVFKSKASLLPLLLSDLGFHSEAISSQCVLTVRFLFVFVFQVLALCLCSGILLSWRNCPFENSAPRPFYTCACSLAFLSPASPFCMSTYRILQIPQIMFPCNPFLNYF